MGTLTNIESALQAKLDSITSHPKIQWENADEYKPVIGTRYWRPTHLPFRTTISTCDAQQRHTGLLQVDIIAPSQAGVGQILTDADAIYTAFIGQSLTSGSTRIDIQGIGRGKITNDGKWCIGFVEIYYLCYAH